MSDSRHLKDHYREARIFSHRVLVAALVVLVLLSILVARFYNLQITQHDDYVTRSDRNRVHVQSVPPTRGLIVDVKDRLLAENRSSSTLSIVKERISGDLDATIAKVQRIIDISDSDIERFKKQLSQRRRPFEAVPLRYRLTEAEIARLAVNEYQLDGVEVAAELVRYYPYSELLAHSVGYVGRINDREQTRFSEDDLRRYSGTHTIGKIGLEKQYENILLGEVGGQHVETNARGRVLRVLERQDPEPGSDLKLHLDIDMQTVAHQALGEYRGAIVAIDVNSGGVVAMVSTPSYDPNLFVTGISYAKYNDLNQSKDLPLFNRTLQGQYPPGSTLKPMLGLGALQKNVIDTQYSIRDPGHFRLDGDERLYRDWKREGHGNKVDLYTAIQQSCDTFFWGLAVKMGVDRMHEFGDLFGLGQRSGVDLPSERQGIWPSRTWKRGARGLPWFPGDSLNMSLGQGDVLTTPMQLAVMTAALANRGGHYEPHLVSHINDKPIPPVLLDVIELSDEHWDYIHEAMRAVVHSPRGTARGMGRGLKYDIAGKSGTAQVVGIAQGEEYDSEALAERLRDHALFVGFAPANNPQLAVAVVVENGEGGSTTAAPMLRQVMDAYLLDDNGELKPMYRLNDTANNGSAR